VGSPVRSALPRLFLDHFAPTSLVAEQDGDLAGFLVGLLSPARRAEAYIHFVGVAPAFRGSGLARRLYSRFFELAAADGRTTVRAITSPRNHGSIAFHQAMGFTASEPIADHNGPSAARVLFHLRLDDCGVRGMAH
jgi:predicted GNAT superfamily acetyltransferase